MHSASAVVTELRHHCCHIPLPSTRSLLSSENRSARDGSMWGRFPENKRSIGARSPIQAFTTRLALLISSSHQSPGFFPPGVRKPISYSLSYTFPRVAASGPETHSDGHPYPRDSPVATSLNSLTVNQDGGFFSFFLLTFHHNQVSDLSPL